MPEIGIKLFNNKIKSLGRTNSQQTLETIVTTITDDQDTAEVEFFLIGEKPEGKIDPLGLVTVRNIPPAKAGEPKILVQVDFTPDGDLDLRVQVNNQLSREVVIPGSQLTRPTTTVVKGRPEQAGGTPYDHVELVFSNEPDPAAGKRSSGDRSNVRDSGERGSRQSREGEVEPRGGRIRKIILSLVLIVLVIIFALWLVNFFFPGILGGGGRNSVSSNLSTAAATPEPTRQPVTKAPTALPVTEAPTQKPTVAPLAAGVTDAEVRSFDTWLKNEVPLHFFPDTAELLPAAQANLSSIVKQLDKFRGLVRLSIIGHAANVGTAESQLEVSRLRALYIHDQIVARVGWDSARITVQWKGALEPVYSGQDPARFIENRRVWLSAEALER